MKTQLRCDNCKREYFGDEDLMTEGGEKLCPDCWEDLGIDKPDLIDSWLLDK